MYRSISTLALSAVLLVACGDDDAPADTGTDTAGTATAGAETPAFALVRGQDTLLIEQYTLEGNRVSGTLRDPSGSTVEYETVHALGEGGTSTMRVVMRTSRPDAGPAIVSNFTLRGDSAFLETSRGDSSVTSADAVTRGTLPYMSPSMGMLALVAQSARQIVGDSGQVTLLAASVSQPPLLVTPQVFWRADTAYVIGTDLNRFRLVFSNDRLLSADAPAMQMRAVRLPAGAPLRPSLPQSPAAGGD